MIFPSWLFNSKVFFFKFHDLSVLENVFLILKVSMIFQEAGNPVISPCFAKTMSIITRLYTNLVFAMLSLRSSGLACCHRSSLLCEVFFILLWIACLNDVGWWLLDDAACFGPFAAGTCWLKIYKTTIKCHIIENFKIHLWKFDFDFIYHLIILQHLNSYAFKSCWGKDHSSYMMSEVCSF